jgi:N-acetylglutamate synthase-like GNAT family acetyltransferase
MVEICAGLVADPEVRSFLEANNAARVARRGKLVEAVVRPVIVARENGEVLGVLTYDIVGDACEVLTLHCATPWAGIGTRLLEALTLTARERGCRRLWVVTTNDNVDALRFYQRRDFQLTDLRPGAVHNSRQALKPSIPETGSHGIPLRDELELARTI